MRALCPVLLACLALPVATWAKPPGPGTPPATAGKGQPPAPGKPDAKATAVPPSVDPVGPVAAGACVLPADAQTLDVAVGGSQTSRGGLRVDYAGVTRDHYGDGRFEIFATLRFRRGTGEEQRLPSVLAPSPASVVLGHCVRLRSADDRRAVLLVAALPDPVKPAKPVDKPPTVRHLGDGRCEPMPREHAPCSDGDGYCVLSWGKPQGWSSALWCRGGKWVIENERNL